ncbi:hypothetical protein [Croceibacterium salegens]|uniref:hypothetical protein n=1 Tax=Croceibacterium salegens TaxID=1737568 RepID=UPI001F44DD8F|nr:hypothetical protein [Croceibacterium salegens]
MLRHLIRPAILIAATATLGACTSYGGYGRSYASVGYSSGGYYPYTSRYPRYGYYGWYGDFYYPGTGYYVYDRHGRKHRWDDRQRRYWESRRGDHHDGRAHWDGYRRDDRRGNYSRGRGYDDRQGYHGQRGDRRDDHRSGRGERPSKSVDRGKEFSKKNRN